MALDGFIGAEPTQNQQFQINGGLLALKSDIDGLDQVMKSVSLRRNADREEEEEQEEEDEQED